MRSSGGSLVGEEEEILMRVSFRRPWAAASRVLALAGMVSIALSAVADDGDRLVSIRGFGGWAYGDTDGNRYLTGSEEGQYDNVGVSLALSASPYERLRISSQLEVFSDPTSDDNAEVELDYAFAEWAFSDAIHGRAGRSKHPFGIYAEIFDVGTLRPFFDLPQGIYGPTAIAGESYDGIGLTGRKRFGDWDLQFDAYVGSLRFEALEPWDGLRDEDDDAPGDDEDEELVENKERDEVVGFRLDFETPVNGLTFGFSGYTGTAQDDEGLGGEEGDEPGEEEEGELRNTGFGLHLEYATGPWTLRMEVAHLDEEDEVATDAAYVELAYQLTDRWQLAFRYDRADTKVREVDISDVPTLGEHDDLAFGVNYWFSTDLVLKLSIHQVEGNRLALPEEADLAIDTGTLDDETTLVSFGAQFSF